MICDKYRGKNTGAQSVVCLYHHEQQFLVGITDTLFFCPKAMGSHRTL
jgi:hypothetical protein